MVRFGQRGVLLFCVAHKYTVKQIGAHNQDSLLPTYAIRDAYGGRGHVLTESRM